MFSEHLEKGIEMLPENGLNINSKLFIFCLSERIQHIFMVYDSVAHLNVTLM